MITDSLPSLCPDHLPLMACRKKLDPEDLTQSARFSHYKTRKVRFKRRHA